MVPDSEILCILVEALTALDIGEFTVKVRFVLGSLPAFPLPSAYVRKRAKQRRWSFVRPS